MHFDNKAQEWDNDPAKTIRAKAFADEIMEFIPYEKRSKALEFGCGTGLLSFQMKDFFKKITLADNSEGMLKVLKEKINAQGIQNFWPLLISDYKKDLAINSYETIYTLMTLHHIHDINSILNIFNLALKSNGYLCIGDIVSEDGSFHSQFPDFDGHKGFDKDKLSKLLQKNGFQVEYHKIVYQIERKTKSKVKKYPLFLLIAKKISNLII